jgi:hypothetical protein
MDNETDRDGNRVCVCVCRGVVRGYVMGGSIRNTLLTTSHPPSVSNLEAVKRLLARSPFHP